MAVACLKQEMPASVIYSIYLTFLTSRCKMQPGKADDYIKLFNFEKWGGGGGLNRALGHFYSGTSFSSDSFCGHFILAHEWPH